MCTLLSAGCLSTGNPGNKNSYRKENTQALSEARAIFAGLEKLSGPKTVESVLVPLNELSIILDRTANRASLFRETHPDPDIRSIAESFEQEIAKLGTEISLSRPLYEACAAVDITASDAATQRLQKHLMRDFRRAGVNKSEETRARISKIQEELVKLSQEFARNISTDVRSIKVTAAELEGLPADFIASHRPDHDGLVKITTDYPDYVPFMQYAKSDSRRLELYREYRARAYPTNETVLKNILAKRHELARLLDYTDYAEYVIETKMARNATNVRQFIDKISEVARPRAEKDYAILLERQRKITPDATRVGDWQKTFLTELVKQEQYRIDSRELRQYFQTGRVRAGIFNIVCTLFDVTIRPWQTPVWHSSVSAFEMVEGTNIVGRFYLDLYPRENKYKHAAHFQLISGVDGRTIPTAALVCNFPGEGDESALMEHHDVETFLHEFGHMLHHLFGGHQRWINFSGIATEHDFVEAPSQMLEEWIWNPAILRTFAVNHKGETIPADLVDRMTAAKDFAIGLDKRHQMFYAAMSLNYYNCDPASLDLAATMKDLQNRYAPYEYVPGTHMYASFGHLDGYSAMYYSYMWAEVIAKDLFSQFETGGMLNPEVGRKYRNSILAPGGSKDAADLVQDFLGRPYSFEPFARWLQAGK